MSSEPVDDVGVMVTVRREVLLPTRLPDGSSVPATLITFRGLRDGLEHIALGLGDRTGRAGRADRADSVPAGRSSRAVPLVRLHSECLTGDVFGSERCDCGPQLHEAILRISQSGGYLLYLRQEGRGIGLYNKIDAYALQEDGLDTYEANVALGFGEDERDYGVAVEMLRALGVDRLDLLSNNPDKGAGLELGGITVERRVRTNLHLSAVNGDYLAAKAGHGRHRIDLPSPQSPLPKWGDRAMTAGRDEGDRKAGVRHYYDSNTWKFLVSGNQRAIHRGLWGPGVNSPGEAAHHAHALVLDEVRPDHERVLDLGCGVGTAALYVALRRPVEVVGVSISPAQVALAERFAARGSPLQGSVRFETADFTRLPEELASFDLAFAIESFVHADPAAAFFHEAARALRPGGVLIVIDDVRVAEADDPRLRDFRTGWHIASLLSVPEAARIAAEAGLDLVRTEDLSVLQRLGRPRDMIIRAARPALRRLMSRSVWAQSLVGGDALQRCHQQGLLEYRLLRFERRS